MTVFRAEYCMKVNFQYYLCMEFRNLFISRGAPTDPCGPWSNDNHNFFTHRTETMEDPSMMDIMADMGSIFLTLPLIATLSQVAIAKAFCKF